MYIRLAINASRSNTSRSVRENLEVLRRRRVDRPFMLMNMEPRRISMMEEMLQLGMKEGILDRRRRRDCPKFPLWMIILMRRLRVCLRHRLYLRLRRRFPLLTK